GLDDPRVEIAEVHRRQVGAGDGDVGEVRRRLHEAGGGDLAKGIGPGRHLGEGVVAGGVGLGGVLVRNLGAVAVGVQEDGDVGQTLVVGILGSVAVVVPVDLAANAGGRDEDLPGAAASRAGRQDVLLRQVLQVGYGRVGQELAELLPVPAQVHRMVNAAPRADGQGGDGVLPID